MRHARLLAIALILGGSACGASIQAVYEGDVRFEHCMALDSRSDVKPTLRSACWEEWTKFYTFGQTRDRVEYAKHREKQLDASSDFDEADVAAAPTQAKAAIPEPTSVLAPPPIILASDGGSPPSDTDESDAGPDDDVDAGSPEPPGAACVRECEDVWALCRKDCAISTCNKACDAKHKRCMRRCF